MIWTVPAKWRMKRSLRSRCARKTLDGITLAQVSGVDTQVDPREVFTAPHEGAHHERPAARVENQPSSAWSGCALANPIGAVAPARKDHRSPPQVVHHRANGRGGLGPARRALPRADAQ